MGKAQWGRVGGVGLGELGGGGGAGVKLKACRARGGEAGPAEGPRHITHFQPRFIRRTYVRVA